MERGREEAGEDGALSGRSAAKMFEVHVGYDERSKVYYVLSSNIPGLHIEAPTFESFVEIAQDAAPDLIDRSDARATFTFNRTVDLVPIDGQ